MNILEITNLIRTTEDALAFLPQRGVLRALDRPPIRPVCGEEMQLKRRQSRYYVRGLLKFNLFTKSNLNY